MLKFMRYGESSSKKKIIIVINGYFKKKRKISNKQPNLIPQGTKKKRIN